MCTRISMGAVIAIAVVAALSGALVVRQNAALAQQRDAEQAQLQVQEAQLLDKIRKLEADKVELEERHPRGPQPKPADFKPDAPRPTFQAATLPRYEYKVFTLPDHDGEADTFLAQMSGDGWDYAGVVQDHTRLAMQNGVQVHQGARLLFKRVKK
jgi:type II secretory pathway pseudopilin PulG